MALAELKGWDPTGGVWRPIKVDSSGRAVISAALLFENPPTEDEEGKGPSSAWAFDHGANAAAHHAKYTDAEARSATGDLLDSVGKALKKLNMNINDIENLRSFILKKAGPDYWTTHFSTNSTSADIYVFGNHSVYGPQGVNWYLYDGTAYRLLLNEVQGDAKIATHAAIADAHHARYTDEEARGACNLAGTLYWSCPGVAFQTDNDSTRNCQRGADGSMVALADGIPFILGVNLPDGATVTGVVVYGNDAAQDETWVMHRVTLDGTTTDDMATAAIDTEDTSISYPVIDNSQYCYLIYTSTLDTNDAIYGARIIFIL